VETESERLLFTQLDEVYWLAFSRDGRRLAVGGWPYVIEVYDLEQGDNRLCRIPLGEPFAVFEDAPALSPDGQVLAVFDEQGIALWDAATGRLRHRITGDSRTLQTAIFTLGFALWAAAWGIVRKRERLRREGSRIRETRPISQPVGPPPVPELPFNKSLPDMAWLLILAALLVGVPLFVFSWNQPWSFQVTVETVGFVLAVLVFLFLIAPVWAGLRRLAYGPHHAYLDRLRAIVRDEGRMHTFGQLRVWCSGRTYSEPEFARIYEETVRRAGELFGTHRELSRPSLVAVLDWQDEFAAFFGGLPPAGIAPPSQWTDRVAILCEESALASLMAPAAAYRAALAMLLQVEHKGDVLPGWVAQFAAQPLVWDDELPAQRRGVARQLKACYCRCPDWVPQQIFLQSEADHTRRWMEDPVESFWESMDEAAFVFALADALLGEKASRERREAAFRWLRAFRPHNEPLDSLQRACGLTLEDLIAIVRDWTAEHATTTYDAMPPFKQYVLQTVHAPAVDNVELSLELRRWIVQAMGTCDYVAAAEPLMALVDQPDSPLRAEAIAALERLSGEPFGDDPAQWRAWWNDLPSEVRPTMRRYSTRPADGPIWWQADSAELSTAEADIALPQYPEEQETTALDALAHPSQPVELLWVWTLMAVGGLVALALPIGFLFAAGPVVFPTVYLGLFVGTAAMARAAARDEAGLSGTATLQALNLLACDPVNPLLAAFELTFLQRPHVQSYLEHVAQGRLPQHPSPVQ
jgi:hypothetical protein